MSDAAVPYTVRKTRNTALVIGAAMALVVLVLALFGPLLAPADPMKENFIAEYGGKFNKPPFPPGVEGFPLGADEFGRDVLSRLLWAIRPTMTLVIVVASLRMAVGLFVGLIAGWANGRLSRVLDTIISTSLAIPVLFIALCVIAALASRWGVWAFILGLTVTGWAEGARLVQEQTRAVKAQPFVEATRALGAAGPQIVLGHVIPHVLPLIWIQLAFEVSAALLTAAALGFLGYFVNAVWIPLEDWVSLRASGMPELGQMLGVSARTQPWTAVFTGSVIFFIILAFNLLGEGLRNALGPERRRSVAGSTRVVDQAGTWLEERLFFALAEWRRAAATGGAFLALGLLALGGGWVLWRAQATNIPMPKIQVPGRHVWASDMHDAQGTGWSPVHGPAAGSVLWNYKAPGTILGGPVVDREGNLYINVSGGRMVSLYPDGRERGFAQLPADAVGSPAITPEGDIIVADVRGSLAAFTPEGTLLWEYLSDPPDEGLSSPIVGEDGLIYFAAKNFLVAVTPFGKRHWQILLPTYSYTSPVPRLSADGTLIFFEDYVIDSQTGQTLFKESIGPGERYLTGADGKTYFRTTDAFLEWEPTEKGAVMIPKARLNAYVLASSARFPFLSGVSPSGQIWLLYTSPYEFARIVWVANENTPQIFDMPYRGGSLIGIDADAAGYLCGNATGQLECRAVQLPTGMLLWKATLGEETIVAGGALAPGRLYLTTADGQVIAIGQ